MVVPKGVVCTSEILASASSKRLLPCKRLYAVSTATGRFSPNGSRLRLARRRQESRTSRAASRAARDRRCLPVLPIDKDLSAMRAYTYRSSEVLSGAEQPRSGQTTPTEVLCLSGSSIGQKSRIVDNRSDAGSGDSAIHGVSFRGSLEVGTRCCSNT